MGFSADVQVLHKCRYTDIYVDEKEVIWISGFIVGSRYPIANTEEAKRLHKQSRRDFDECEANCNTCFFLERVKHKKCKQGFLQGRCTNPNRDIWVDGNIIREEWDARWKAGEFPCEWGCRPYPHLIEGDVFVFHPEDPMHMTCYKPRWADDGGN